MESFLIDIFYCIQICTKWQSIIRSFYHHLLILHFSHFFRMMPSSPLIGRRSGTASPQMDHIDVVKDNVIGELASRIGRPIPEFNKNKRGM